MSQDDIQNLNKFFITAINIIFGVVVALSFRTLSEVVFGLSFTDPVIFIDLLSLVLVYFVVFSSWLGHYRSIMHWPYSIGTSGIVRFILSILILFVYYYTFNLFTEPTEIKRSDFFIYPLPVIFLAYFIFDRIKNREYISRASKKEKAEMDYRSGITLLFLIFSVILAISYFLIKVARVFEPYSFADAEIWRLFFLVLLGLIVFYYRYTKRQIKSQRVRLKM